MRLSFAAIFLVLATAAHAQTPTRVDPEPRPVPDVETLMSQVEQRQYASEVLEKQYIYHQQTTTENLNGKGDVKKTETEDVEVFWVNGVRIERMLKKNGVPLSPDEQKKESARIDKEIAKAKAHEAKQASEGKGGETGGPDEMSFARMLQLATFNNPRRESIGGRDTLIVDFTGDPSAKSHNESEAFFKVLAGTVYIDEQDRVVSRIDVHMIKDFKIGGGLFADVHQGTWAKVTFTKINDEIWFPATAEGNGRARVLLLISFNGNFHIQTSDFRKFHATSTLLPTVTPVEPSAEAPPKQ